LTSRWVDFKTTYQLDGCHPKSTHACPIAWGNKEKEKRKKKKKKGHNLVIHIEEKRNMGKKLGTKGKEGMGTHTREEKRKKKRDKRETTREKKEIEVFWVWRKRRK
jgi:hypothetical protein